MQQNMRSDRNSGKGLFRYRFMSGALVPVIAVIMVLFPTGELRASEACDKARDYYEQGTKVVNFGERKELFAKAVELCPTYAEAQVNLADTYENLGDFEAAERHYSAAVSLGLRSANPYIGLGEVYLKTGRYGLALETFERGMEVGPENERLQAGMRIAAERMTREKKLLTATQIKDCLVEDEQFRLMCMCPGTTYGFLRKWICMPATFFASGSVRLSGDAQRQLDEVGKALNSQELKDWSSWLVIGHADSLGTEERNVMLSKNRAERVKRYLVDRHGIEASRLRVLFYGEKRPRSGNAASEGRTENRRVEIIPDNL